MPLGEPVSRRLPVILAVIALVLGLFFLLRPREQGKSPSDASVSAATAAGRATGAPHARAGAPQRVSLTGGETKAIDESVLGALEGRVVSANGGAPIVGAQVTVVGPDGSHATQSREGGSFTFTPAREGVYEITLVSAVGFVSFAPELGASPISWVARKGASITGITLRLDPSVEYLGRVVDPEGAPVSGAEVRIFDAESVEFALSGFATRHVSDDKGEFQFQAPDGSILEARRAGFSPGRAELGFSAQASHRLVIKLAPSSTTEKLGTIRGVVVDESGVPIPDAAVVAHPIVDNPAAEGARLNPGGSERTDPHGAFTLEGLIDGSYSIVASDGDHASATERSVHTGDAPIRLVLTGGASLTGRVTDAATGAPIPAISVVLAKRTGLLSQVEKTATSFDSEGRYTVRHIAAGTYVVTVTAEGYAPSPDREVAIERDTTSDFSLTRGARLVGEVRDSKTKTPIEQAKVSLEGQYGSSQGAAALSPSAVSDKSGHFEVTGLGSGERSFLVAATGHHGRVVGGLVFRGGDVVGPIVIELTPTDKDEEPRVELVGIGAVLAPKDDHLIIGKVIAGGGAAEAGLGPGDMVLAIDGVAIAELGFAGAIQKIRGPEGTVVTLLVQRKAAAAAPVRVTRRRVAA